MKRAENHYFSGLTLLQFTTYLTQGHYRPGQPIILGLSVVVAGLFLWVLCGFAVSWHRSPARWALMAPLAYFVLQTCSAGLAVYSTPLYAFGLAMHYVEYHVLMASRCFAVTLDQRSPTDRLFGRLRQHKILFYGLLLILAVPVTRFAWLGMSAMMRAAEQSWGTPSRILIAAFDGLFVCHYIIESRVWRFSEPFYRRSLLPLYFGPVGPSASSTPAPFPSDPLATASPTTLARSV
jgi:hypothetical protein